MGVSYNPKIVTDGLQLYLDAANPKSYPGTGTVWTDLSGNLNNATITSTSFLENSIVYNGSSSYGTVGSSNFFDLSNNFRASTGYSWSVSVWFKFPISPTTSRTGNASYAICGQGGGIGGGETLTIFVGSGTDSTFGPYSPYYCAVGTFGAKTIISPNPVNTNTWNNVCVTWNGISGKTFFNGIERSNLNVGAAAAQTTFLFGIGQVGTSSHSANVAQIFEGSIGSILVYGTALSNKSVLSNFNSIRGRYGI